jgi:hypothetical protein
MISYLNIKMIPYSSRNQEIHCFLPCAILVGESQKSPEILAEKGDADNVERLKIHHFGDGWTVYMRPSDTEQMR